MSGIYIPDVGLPETNDTYTLFLSHDGTVHLWRGPHAMVGHEFKAIPAADVRENKRGKWVYLSNNVWQCSECGRKVYGEQVNSPDDGERDVFLDFCPNCGARMEES